jgi:hypothetical protein
MDKGQIGNVYYGLSDGTADNFERAQRDAKLIKNSVLLRMGNGETVDAAIDATSKDLYGDLQIVEGDGRVNTQLLLPSSVDPRPIVDGLAARLPDVEKVVSDTLGRVPLKLEPGTSNEAVMKAVRENYVKNVSSQGYFKTVPGGYIFIDPYRGSAVSDDKGKPVLFQPADVSATDKASQNQQLDGSQPVDQTQEQKNIDQYGKLGVQMMKDQSAADQAAKQLTTGDQPVAASPDVAEPVAGMTEKGNIDLAKRPVVKNKDGTISTVRSMSFEEDGQEVLIPTVSDDGKILSNEDAIDLYHKTGKFLGKFASPAAADMYAEKLHSAQGGYYKDAVPSVDNSSDQPPVIQRDQSTPMRLDRQGLQDEIRKAREAAEQQFKDESKLVRTQEIRKAEREARDRWEKAGGKM